MDSLRHNFRPNKAEINTAIIHVQAGLISLAFYPISEELQEDTIPLSQSTPLVVD